jgi:toxin-antitoxin system PIN domain toxin
MTLADSNVWLALVLTGHSHHGTASRWFTEQARPGDILFCRGTQTALLRLLTTGAVLAPYGVLPLTNEEAWHVYDSLAADARIGFAIEPPGIEEHWKRLASRATSSPKLWMDAYLAAFAIAGGHRLVTSDAAYRQFEGLDLMVLQ